MLKHLLYFNDLKLYPNPTNDILYIEHEAPLSRLVIRDLQGRVVADVKLTGTSAKFDTRVLTKGMYLATVTNTQFSHTKKLVVN